jgi:hypothetical protein
MFLSSCIVSAHYCLHPRSCQLRSCSIPTQNDLGDRPTVVIRPSTTPPPRPAVIRPSTTPPPRPASKPSQAQRPYPQSGRAAVPILLGAGGAFVPTALLVRRRCWPLLRPPSRTALLPHPTTLSPPVPWIKATTRLRVQPMSRGRRNHCISRISCNATKKVTNQTHVLVGFVQFFLINHPAPLLSLKITRQGNRR